MLPLAGIAVAALGLESPAADYSEFEQFLEEFRREHRVLSFSVALVDRGEIVYSKGIGWQDHDAEERTTTETSYLVASITKTFAAATLLGMDDDGYIDLDADFASLSDWDGRCEWLGGAPTIFGGGTLDNGTIVGEVPCDRSISLRQVLTHRVNGEPGSDFIYNPIVFGRLSNWVEENTDRSWRDWMYEYVITPGKLDNTAAGWRDPNKGHVLTHLAPPFRHTDPETDGDGLAPSVLPNPELNASSGIIASAEELAYYSIALMDGRILSPQLLEEMWTPPTKPSGEAEPYAYGWYVEDYAGEKVVWHGGWWPDAYAGFILIAPESGKAMVALGNADGLRWEKSIDEAGIQGSPLADEYLKRFVMQDDE
jgi:CubicO group peptidase (beta-lactamase class C family)